MLSLLDITTFDNLAEVGAMARKLILVFYRPCGQLMMPYATFKSTIMLVGVISGCYLVYRYFKFVDAQFVTIALIVGFSWLAINIVLDILFLLPFTKTTYSDYFTTIGIGYFSIPTISITLGYFLDRKPY